MINRKKVVVIMPAYNAEKTLLQTHREVLQQDMVDLVIVVDDDSSDRRCLGNKHVISSDFFCGIQ
jgi:glycosyltransferase involved in cell wall biosynthesis